MQFDTKPEFDAEFKKLFKKYRSLKEDIELLKSVLEKYPRGYEPFTFRISGLGINTEIYKVKHFRCAALKNKGSRSGIRIVYAYLETEQKIEFVEMYYKEKDDVDCNRERIRKYYT